jgi:hypothetical protein
VAGTAFTYMLRTDARCCPPNFYGQRVRSANITVELAHSILFDMRLLSFSMMDFD